MKIFRDDQPDWSSFHDVIGEITDPVVAGAGERIKKITEALGASVNEVDSQVGGLREEHRRAVIRAAEKRDEGVGRVLQGVGDARTELADALDRAQRDLHDQAARAQYELHTHVEQTYTDLRARVDRIQRELGDAGATERQQLRHALEVGLHDLTEEVRYRDAAATDRLEAMAAAGRRPDADLRAVVASTEVLAARTAVLVRLTCAMTAVTLVIVVAAVLLAALR